LLFRRDQFRPLVRGRGRRKRGFPTRVGQSFPTEFLCAIIALKVLKVKDTLRSTVNLTFDGRVVKNYHGPDARERFEHEVGVLRYLEMHDCNFVPKLIEADPEELRIVTTNCGTRVERIDDERIKELFAELETYGVRHDDPDPRNITYRQADGRFCLVDFELATILPDAPVTPA
jgi:tRNA A-37 threonylcarbamoyl transferase component Bud32